MGISEAEVSRAKERLSRGHHRADNKNLPRIHDLAEFPPLPQLAEAKNKANDMAKQLARLEDQNKFLQARINEASNLTTYMVGPLTDCGACLSSDGKKKARELLLEIQGHTLQDFYQDSQGSPLPLDNGPAIHAGYKRRADPVCSRAEQPTQSDRSEVQRGSKGQGSSTADAARGCPIQFLQDPATESSAARRVFSSLMETGCRAPPISRPQIWPRHKASKNNWQISRR